MLLTVDFAPTIYLPGTEYNYVHHLTAPQSYEANIQRSVSHSGKLQQRAERR